MDLYKNGNLLRALRKAKGMTQKEVAEKLGVVPKTVSKWETGHGFPDVSAVSSIADMLDVSEKTILSGNLAINPKEAGNMKRIKFYVCPACGSFYEGTGNASVVCCGKRLQTLQAKGIDDAHRIHVSEIEDEYYITWNHEMTKEHFISFAAYVRFDSVLAMRLYPEQDAAIRFPKMHGGTFYYYCVNHGLFATKF